jgi:asparagine synthase (glutamine-hydrolysing)
LAPETCFKNIFSLKPGFFISIDLKNQEIIQEKFWELSLESIPTISEQEAVEKIDLLLAESISSN